MQTPAVPLHCATAARLKQMPTALVAVTEALRGKAYAPDGGEIEGAGSVWEKAIISPRYEHKTGETGQSFR